MTSRGVEIRRKAVHVGMAGFAFALPSLGVTLSALAAALALLFNLLVLPRLAGTSLSRDADLGHRVPPGIAHYPATVLALILLFAPRLELAAAGWGYLAFGDGLASVVGRALGGPRLPWSRAKTVSGSAAFVLFGTSGGALLYGWCLGRLPTGTDLAALLAGALSAALLESLPPLIDDNVLPPVVGAAVLAGTLVLFPGLLRITPGEVVRQIVFAALVNAGIASLASLVRVVRPSGALAGFLLGTFVLASGGWSAYLLLWLFFAVGTLLTWIGRAKKEAIGRAEKAGGRRGAANVIANVSVGAFCAAVGNLGGQDAFPWRLAATAAFATVLADTTGTEVGQAVRTPTFLLPDLRRVPPGTDGAVSVAGTLAGLLAALLVGGSGVISGFVSPLPGLAATGVVGASALVGSATESLLQRDGASWKVTDGHLLNFVSATVGAGTAALLCRLL